VRQLELFLSYSSEDRDLARQVREAIIQQGHHVWQDDQELLAGDDINSKLRRTLRNSDGYLVLITPNALRSTWVLIELGGAWVSGIPLYPLLSGTSVKNLPDPLRQLNVCSVDAISTKLIPALARLSSELGLSSELIDETELDHISLSACNDAGIGRLAKDIAPLVAQAFSTNREARRLSHTTVRQCAQSLRSAFLETMVLLSAHPIERIRGEAYYCLGDLRHHPSGYLKDETFFCNGLFDDSVWVQACCANVLKNFAPLSEATIERLQECLTGNIFRFDKGGPVSSLVYYASATINTHIGTTLTAQDG